MRQTRPELLSLLSVSVRRTDELPKLLTFCHRLGRRCNYEPRTLPLNRESSALSPTARLHVPKSFPVSPPSTFDSGTFLKSSVNIAITEKLALAFGDISSLRANAVKYFGSIHLWFPILSDVSYYERLSSVFSQPCAEYSLLSLSMALITTIPPERETWESFSSLYMLVKSSIAIVEAANIHSMEVVQARLLVTLFEVGHVIEPAAFISLGAVARAAVAIGLNRTVTDSSSDDKDVYSKTEEGLRVWWGIVMVDR